MIQLLTIYHKRSTVAFYYWYINILQYHKLYYVFVFKIIY